MSQNLVVHHLNNSRSQRIIWLLQELGLTFSIKKYQRGPDMLAPQELKDVHPLGKSPVLTDGKYTLAESGAIIEYVVDKYGPQMKPTDIDEKIQYTYWLHYAEGSLMSPLLLKLVFDSVVDKVPFLIRPIMKGVRDAVGNATYLPNLKGAFSFIESHLEKNEYFAGKNFSAADIQMIFGVQAGASRVSDMVGPKTKEWLAKMEARDAYKKAIELGGEYTV